MTTEVKKRGRKAKDPTNTDSNKNTENIPKKEDVSQKEVRSFNKIYPRLNK